jgi:hypothetical protein
LQLPKVFVRPILCPAVNDWFHWRRDNLISLRCLVFCLSRFVFWFIFKSVKICRSHSLWVYIRCTWGVRVALNLFQSLTEFGQFDSKESLLLAVFYRRELSVRVSVCVGSRSFGVPLHIFFCYSVLYLYAGSLDSTRCVGVLFWFFTC